MEDACKNLVKKVLSKEKLTHPQWQLLEVRGFAQREMRDNAEAKLQFTSNGKIESGYELTDEGRKLAAKE